jgi:hypothetical protein
MIDPFLSGCIGFALGTLFATLLIIYLDKRL